MKKIIMLLTNPFYPDPRPLKEAKILIRNNFSVEIYAWNRASSTQYAQREMYDELLVNRIDSFGGYGKGIKSLFAFALFYMRLIMSLWNKKYIDIIYAHDLDTLLPGLFLANRLNAKLILDSHELYEGMIFKSRPFLRSVTVKIIRIIKKVSYPKVDLFIFTNDIMYDYDKTCIKGEMNYIIIKNYPEIRMLKNVLQNNLSTINLCFFGKVRDYYILTEVAEAVERQKGKFRFYVAGSGQDADKLNEKFESYEFCVYLGTFKYIDLARLYNKMDIAICLYHIDLNSISAFPVKFYEAYEIGLPVISFRGTQLGKFCEKYNLGYTLDNVKEIMSFLETIDRQKIEITKQNIKKTKKFFRFYFEDQEKEYIDKIKEILLT